MPRKKIIATEFRLPDTDVPEFELLYRALYAAFGSQRKVAKAMGISYPTWCRYERVPPTWPYYNMVMEQVLRARLRGMKIDRRGFTSAQHYKLSQTLGKLHSFNDIMDQIEADTAKIHEAMDHLREKLSHRGMFLDELLSARHSGGFSGRQLRRAAAKLAVVKDVRGFGEDRRHYWKLPSTATDEV